MTTNPPQPGLTLQPNLSAALIWNRSRNGDSGDVMESSYTLDQRDNQGYGIAVGYSKKIWLKLLLCADKNLYP